MRINSLPEIESLSELVGEFIEYWGFKKIHGKIWVHIYLSEKSIDAKEIMARLSISKALVSITIKDLLEYQVIFEGPLSAEGTRTYVPNKDVNLVIQNILRSREKVMMGKIKSSLQNLKDISEEETQKHNISTSKIKEVEKLIQRGDKMLATVITLIK